LVTFIHFKFLSARVICTKWLLVYKPWLVPRNHPWLPCSMPPLHDVTGRYLSYPIFIPKPRTHRMYDPWSIVPHIRPKVFTHNQMSWIKYNYYINNVSKDYDEFQAKRNSRRLHNSTGTTARGTHSLELLVEEFQSIFSF
jgi:hypothetical protein